MHLLLVVNTVASSVTDRRRSEVEARLAATHDLDIVTTTHRGHATDVAAAAAAQGVGAVVVLGGDGTLNEVANGLLGSDCVLAPLPGGSTNVFARSIGLPRDATEAATATAEALAHHDVERISVGEVRADDSAPRAFLCHTGIGWDAALVADVERRRATRHRATLPLFAGAGLRTFFGGFDRRAPHFDLTLRSVGAPTDDPTELSTTVDCRFALVMNSDPYTYVGRRPFRVAPAADRHSALAVVAMDHLGTATFLRTMGQALGGAGLRPRSHVEVRSEVVGVEVERHPTRTDGVPYQVDGDHLGSFSHLSFRHRPEVLAVIRPRGNRTEAPRSDQAS